MATIDEQIQDIEKEIRETPYHKATEHHIGHLRAKLSRLKDRVIESASISKGGGGGGYTVKKQGDATVVLIGPPSAGKSTLINKLTNAQSKAAPYAFTTVSVIPGMMKFKNARIQILDVPGLIEGAEEGKGRGREVLSVTRGTDLIILMTDHKRLDAIKRIETMLAKNGIRLNIKKPNVTIEKKLSGGIIVHTNIKQTFDKETVKKAAGEFGIKNAEITINEKLTLERLFDAFSRNRVYLPNITIVNKADETKKREAKGAFYISAKNGSGLEKLKKEIWKKLEFAQIFLVKKDKEPNKNNPMIVKKGTTLWEVAEKIGPDFLENTKGAKIWGSGAKFDGQEVSLGTKVRDEMMTRFI